MYNLSLTKDQILSYDQTKMFSTFLGLDVNLNKSYRNPLRENDDDAGCFFSWYKQKLFFVDFAHTKTHIDVFDAVMYSQGVGFKDAVNILSDFVVSNKTEYIAKPSCNSNRQYSDYTPIVFHTRQFNERDKQYWSSFGISSKNLEEDHVYGVEWYKFYSRKHDRWCIQKPIDICYGLYFGNEKSVKIYRPKGTKKEKWLSNVKKNVVSGGSQVVAQPIIITKSYKDWRVLKNIGLKNVRWVQSENVSVDVLLTASERATECILLYDNDVKGYELSQTRMEEFNAVRPNQCRAVYIPSATSKDSSDYVRDRGYDSLIQFAKANRLYEYSSNYA